jgi:uncharacterized protein YukJ
MPLSNYEILKGKAVNAKREENVDTPHYQVEIVAQQRHYRIAINVKSQTNPSDLLFLVNENFIHPVTATLPALPDGLSTLQRKAGGRALDFIRGNLFLQDNMRPLPPNLPGPDNDLSDRIEFFVRRAMKEGDARVYAFGEEWGPEMGTPDKIFSFTPGNGIHNIHMNQGNVGRFTSDDGVWQDGALLFHFPSTNQWVALYLAFQSQSWHTDDVTGHTLSSPAVVERMVRIVAALVHPAGAEAGAEGITLLNASPSPVDLKGWQLADRQNNREPLSGVIPSGNSVRIRVSGGMVLDNRGGTITLLNDKGLKVDGVSYTAEQGKKEGWTIVF